jgi:hypothetical protein
MDKSCVYIQSAAALGPTGDTRRTERVSLAADPPPRELKELVKQVVGVPLRQASHFVELAAIASQLCIKRLGYPAPEDTAVYVGTGLAEVRKTHALFQQVMPPGPGMASPFDFINAANNMAAFYVAKLGNFRARNLTVSQEEFSFEWALQLAWADLRAGDYRQALVGGVDENSQPRAQHLRRMALRDDQMIGEGAGFFFLSAEPERACAEILGVRHLDAQAIGIELPRQLADWRQDREPVTLLPGFRLSAEEITHLIHSSPDIDVQPYLQHCGCFHTATAFGLAAALDDPADTSGLVVHVNRNRAGQWMIVGIRYLTG